MKYNEGQLRAIDSIIKWANTSNLPKSQRFKTLSGYAGTGKSTILDEIIRNISGNIVVSAPTHKAKEVIQNKTNKPGETIQALLGLRPDVDLEHFNPNKPTFNVIAEERIKYYNYVFIDECSMLSAKLTSTLEETAKKYNTKVLYIGDKYQLPPVKEKIATCFTHHEVFQLDEIMRQNYSNPNTKLIEIARNDVKNGTNYLDKYIKDVKHNINGDEGFQVLNREPFFKTLVNYYHDSEYQVNVDFAKTICYTNQSVAQVNAFIKNRINPSKELIAVGDNLMGYTNVSYQIEGPPYYIPIISNSKDYKVEEVELTEYPIEGVVYKGYRTKLHMQARQLFILHPDSYKDFTREYLIRLQEAKNLRKWPQYYRFKNQIQLLHNIMNPYDLNKVLVNKDIDFGYALTVHKSQGSTYDNVGVLIDNINLNEKANERRQLKYVALSRTSKLNLMYAK